LPGNYRSIEGKQVWMISGSPPRVQTVVDGNKKAKLRAVVEPLFSAERYPAAGTQTISFFQTTVGNATPNGLTLGTNLTNMQAQGQLGEPEVHDFAGLAVRFNYGATSAELNALLNTGALVFQFSSSQPVLRIPLDCIPAATGLAGIGDFLQGPSLQVGAPFASNTYDVTVNGYPRRIWSLETFTVEMQFGATPPVLQSALDISVRMYGVHYIR
jgi:hypothetical protein